GGRARALRWGAPAPRSPAPPDLRWAAGVLALAVVGARWVAAWLAVADWLRSRRHRAAIDAAVADAPHPPGPAAWPLYPVDTPGPGRLAVAGVDPRHDSRMRALRDFAAAGATVVVWPFRVD